jgi:hypothetical protein
MNTIQKIFPKAVDLKVFLQKKLHKDATVELPQDSSGFKQFLRDIFVLENEQSENLSFNAIETTNQKKSIRDILNRSIVQLIRTYNNTLVKSQNSLTLGYRRKTGLNNAKMKDQIDIEAAFVNTVHPLLLTSLWEKLLDRIGENAFRFLLEQHLFMKTVNGSFMQVESSLSFLWVLFILHLLVDWITLW